MCIIIDNSTGAKLPSYVIENSLDMNPHGFGLIDLKTGLVYKTQDRSKMEKMMERETPFIAHCRYATVGGKGKAGVHPHRFELGPGTGGWLMQNGTVKGMSGSGSDSSQLSNLLRLIPRENIEEFLGSFESRFLIYFDDGEVLRTGNWIEKDGVQYSKDNVLFDWQSDPASWEWDYAEYEQADEIEPAKSDVELVAVYGTLKSGGSNNHYLSEAEYIDDVTTVDPYRLCVAGLPFLVEGPDMRGDNVEMELYAVDSETLTDLDRLEGHPNWYRRETIEVTDGTSTLYAYVYTVDESYDDGEYYTRFDV
jgi:gamma-glutamylaminecyclotransferase